MADKELRSLKRAWRESEGVEEEANFLAASLRAGSLPSEAVEFAAELGDPAARRALGLEAHAGSPQRDPWEIGPWPGPAALGAVVDLLVRVLEQADPSLAEATRPTISLTVRCLDSGGLESAREVRLAVEELWSTQSQEGGRAGFIAYFAGAAGRYAADLIEGRKRERGWDAWIRSAATRAAEIEDREAVSRALVTGACRQLLQRGQNEWVEATGGRFSAPGPPLESALGPLRSTLRWVDEHLCAFRRLREAGDPAAEQELLRLEREIRDARDEAGRVADLLRHWREAAEPDSG